MVEYYTVSQNPQKIPLMTGEKALRELRSLWLVPSLIFLAIAALLYSVDRFAQSFFGRSVWFWGALLVFLIVWVLFNRRARMLAATLQDRNREIAASRDQLAALNTIGRAIAAELDLNKTLEAICAQTASALGARRTAVALRAIADSPDRICAAYGFPDSTLPDLASVSLPSAGGIKEAISGRDGVPLGTLYVFDKRHGSAFHSADQTMLASIATQAAVAITNARLYEDVRKRSADLRSLAQRVADAIAASDDRERIADLVAEQALKLVACGVAGLLLLDKDRRVLLPTALRFAESGLYPPPRAFFAGGLSLEANPALQALLTAQSPSLLTDTHALGETNFWAVAGIRALIAAPLRGHNQATLGILLLAWTDAPHRSDDEEAGLVGALAGFASVAFENARLTTEARSDQQRLSEKNSRLLEETERRGEELQTLVRRVGEALAAGFDRDRVAKLVAEQTRRMISCQRVVFSVRDGDDDFRALAIATDEQSAHTHELPAWRLSEFPFLKGVLDRSNPVMIPDVAQEGRLGGRERAALRREDIAAMLIAPLHGRGGQVLGLLSLFWTTTTYTPTPEEFKIADVLAAQAAAALENARLYEDLENAETRLKEQLAEATTARDFVERILQNVQAAVLVLSPDDDYLILNANTLAEAMPDPEYEKDGLSGRRLEDVFPGLKEVLKPLLRRAAASGESATLMDAEYVGFTRGPTYWTFSVTPQRDPVVRRVSQIILLALETTDRIHLLEENRRNALQAQQRASELDATLRSLGDAVILCDSTGHLTSINRAGEAILGEIGGPSQRERVEAWAERVQLRFLSGQPVPPSAIPLIHTLRTGQPTAYEKFYAATPAGETCVIELVATPVIAVESAPQAVLEGVVAVFRDITLLTRSQEQESAVNRRVETLVHISRRLNAALDPAEIHTIVTKGALELLPDIPDLRVLLYDYEEESKVFTLLAEAPQGHPKRPKSLREAQPLTLPFDAAVPLFWQICVSRQSVAGSDIAQDPLFASAAARALLRGTGPLEEKRRSALALPLLAGEIVSGQLILTSSAPAAFDDPRLGDALKNLAALAAIARVNARLYRQTKQRADELDALWTVGQAIAEKLELTEVVDTLTDRVRRVMGAEICTLTLFEKGPTGGRRLLLQGTTHEDAGLYPTGQDEKPEDRCDLVGQEAAIRGREAMLVGLPNPPLGACKWRAFAGQSGFHSVLAVPLKYGEETLGALTVYISGRQPFSPDQIKLLKTLAVLAVGVVRNAQIFAHEQNIAETLQKSFLPEDRTVMAGLDIAEKYWATWLEEARIGGDYYDFIALGPRRLAVLIGDISGKGLAAAVYTAMAKYTLRAFIAQEMPPREVVSRANLTLARSMSSEVFSTLFYGVIDLEAGSLTYVNAGHEPPQLARGSDEIIALGPTGPMLGAFETAEFEEVCLSLQTGDCIALFTDGLPDSRSPKGEFFGEDGIRAHLTAIRQESAEHIALSLRSAALAFAGDARLRDDIALLVLKILPA